MGNTQQNSFTNVLNVYYRKHARLHWRYLGYMDVYSSTQQKNSFIAGLHRQVVMQWTEATRDRTLIQKKNRKKKNFAKYIHITVSQDQSLCHSTAVLTLYIEFYFVNLESIVSEARKLNKPLSIQMVLSIFTTLATTVTEMHKEKIFIGELTPYHLVYDGNKFLLIQTTSFNRQQNTNLLYQDNYLEPSLMQCVSKNRTQVEGYNPYPSDVWALGLILFEAMTLFKPQYLYDCKVKLNEDRLSHGIQMAKKRYGEWAGWCLKHTLERESGERIMAIQLYQEMGSIFRDIKNL